jgi:hypothetical protein
MASIIKIKRSSTTGSVPSLELGEIAVNLFDRKIYVGNGAGVTSMGGEDFRLTTKDSGSEGAYLKLIGDSVLSTNTVFLEASEGIDISRQSNGSIVFSGEDASSTNKGVASFDSGDFVATSGNITLSDSATGAVIAIGGTANEVNVARTNGTVTVGLPNDVDITSSLDVGTNATVGGTLGVTGAATLSSTLGVTGAATLSSTLAVTGASTLTGDVTAQGALRVNGDTILDGNLNVEGALTYISTSTVYADDGMFKLSANNSADTVDTGIYGKYIDGATAKYSGYFRDSSDGTFKFYKESQVEPTTTVDVSATGYTLAQLDAVIDGGSY